MDPHIERMIAEAQQLSERTGKLGDFIGGEIYAGLHDMDRALLNAQFGAMTAYLSILTLRLDRARGL